MGVFPDLPVTLWYRQQFALKGDYGKFKFSYVPFGESLVCLAVTKLIELAVSVNEAIDPSNNVSPRS